MEYKGFFFAVNEKPENEGWIEVFASDWNKDYWGFYAYIRVKHYKRDIEEINKLIHKLNWRDGDTYVELIDYSEGLREFYYKLYEHCHGGFADWAALDAKNWERLG